MNSVLIMILLGIANTTIIKKDLLLATQGEDKREDYCRQVQKDAPKKCTECVASFLNSEDSLCSLPTKKIENCMIYKDKDTCEKCLFNKVISDDKKSCSSLTSVDNCAKIYIDDASKCEVCKEGFTMKDGKCEKGKCTLENCRLCKLKSDEKTEECVLCENDFVRLLEGGSKCVSSKDKSALAGCEQTLDSETCFMCALENFMVEDKDSNFVCKKTKEYEMKYMSSLVFLTNLLMVLFFSI